MPLTLRTLGLAAGLAGLGSAVFGFEPTFPFAVQPLSVRNMPLGSYALPLGPVADDRVPVRLEEGRILRRTWRLNGMATVLQVLAPLREALEADGYKILFQCVAASCGGFDFRFGIDVVPAPDMAVNIGDFQFLSAEDKAGRGLSLLVTRSGNSVYIQLIEVLPEALEVPGSAEATPGPVGTETRVIKPDLPQEQTLAPGDSMIARALRQNGHAVLSDVSFRSGGVGLQNEEIQSLTDIAALLSQIPSVELLIVGHSDTVGSLQSNVAVSRSRAEAVRQVLISRYGIASNRLSAVGAGYMAPLTSNETPEGREQNRRVEVVLLP